ncbi:hypothetical protein HYV84_02555 [Candidatus Woesearchaeota archaeon]|nr:hypothetical protein [Candidatus Woesearchaeota archaeon]
MDKKEQIEKLEQELRFLQESLEAAVVSKDEFERGRKRIESRLEILRNEPDEPESQESDREEGTESLKGRTAEGAREDASGQEQSPEEDRGEGFRDIEGPDKTSEQEPDEGRSEHEPSDDEQIDEKTTDEEQSTERKQPKAEARELRRKPKKKVKITHPVKSPESRKRAVDLDAPKEEKPEIRDEIVETYTTGQSSGAGKGLVVIIILALAIFGGWWLMKGGDKEQNSGLGIASDGGDLASASQPSEMENPVLSVLCSSDTDCMDSGKGDSCRNPGTSEALCETRDESVKVTILSDSSCAFCETARMRGVLKELFPMASFEEISSRDGQELIGRLGIVSLPAYVIGAEVEQAKSFSEFKRALEKKDGYYVVSAKASGAPYFFRRNAVPFELDVFLKSDTRARVLANAQPVLDLFKGKILFEEHVVDGGSGQTGVNDFSISSFPTFIINNQMKFSGIQSPETLKEKFCALNTLPECSQELTESIQ